MGYVLGIDTSNYKTSIAVIDHKKHIICDLRRFLTVKQGERGLRQSDALFQHIQNLAGTDGRDAPDVRRQDRCRCVLVSAAPGSRILYAGVSGRKRICKGGRRCDANVPVVAFFSSGRTYGGDSGLRSLFRPEDRFLACHFSGGTCEGTRRIRDGSAERRNAEAVF